VVAGRLISAVQPRIFPPPGRPLLSKLREELAPTSQTDFSR